MVRKDDPQVLGDVDKVKSSNSRRPVPGKSLEDAWEKRPRDDSNHFWDHVKNNMFNAIRVKLTRSDQQENDAKEGRDEVVEFLNGEGNITKLDDCVRWRLLYAAVECQQGTGDTVQQILSISPHLSFVNLWKDSSKSEAVHRCQDKLHSKKDGFAPSTPFHRAAYHGKVEDLRCFLHYGELLCDEQQKKSVPDRLSWFPGATPERESRDILLEIITRKDTGPFKRTALELAQLRAYEDKDEKNNPRLVVVEELLNFDSRIALHDGAFHEALKDGYLELVNIFLDNRDLKKHFATRKNIIHVIEKMEDDDKDSDRFKIAGRLIASAGCKDVVNEEVIEKIIERNLVSFWEENVNHLELDSKGLLHIAVLHQNVNFVRLFLHRFPKSVSEKFAMARSPEHVCYPLWYNNKVRRGDRWDNRERSRAQADIRDAIVNDTIRQIPRMQYLSDIFRLSSEAVSELCFDLSRSNPTPYPVTYFLASVINHEESARLISYEPTIKYAAFPPLDIGVGDQEIFGERIRAEHTEVFDVLYWLHQSNNVRKIIELKVPDRLVNPHNELKIATYVELLGVEVLDWRFLDLSLSVFKDKVKNQIRTLHLYASGKRAAIGHWLSAEGLKSFPNVSVLQPSRIVPRTNEDIVFDQLTSLGIHVVQELMTERSHRKVLREIRREFQKFKRERDHHPGVPNLDLTVNSQPWNPRPAQLADLDEIAESVVPKLSRFIHSYHDLLSKGNHDGFRPTRVAIIDNGILSISPREDDIQQRILERPKGAQRSHMLPSKPADVQLDLIDLIDPDTHSVVDGGNINNPKQPEKTGNTKKSRSLWSRIREGRSFVEDDVRHSPWMFASDPHGTQMANLICAIDPACELYVARVTEGQHGISPERVVKAIQWAISKEVDIISMSFAILENDGSLKDACNKAKHDHNIVLLCSTHDEGLNVKYAWPADYDSTITITACDEFGHVPSRGHQKYDFALRGLKVAASVIPFLDSSDLISGSSVATAIAAGLSSLILSCDRFARSGQPYHPKDNMKLAKDRVEHYLNQMTSGEKYVLPEKFGNIDAKVKDGEDIDAMKVIHTDFPIARPVNRLSNF
ncbi:hypothetical protein BDV28DRAFT_144762 [Aspergillus coremiiformis]|uniref:Peptidase S8/S53 domain-containing protein n=1 Tax=Aspergillus coremiiformis TaxID=138285 RepID=A0A5N6ZJ78_9EURO|nr:hypothetical protein BDV28DRAFT_144762 [Aspergillus coremiiformis]